MFMFPGVSEMFNGEPLTFFSFRRSTGVLMFTESSQEKGFLGNSNTYKDKNKIDYYTNSKITFGFFNKNDIFFSFIHFNKS